MLEEFKKRLGINHTELDLYIQDLIDAGIADLKDVGIASSILDALSGESPDAKVLQIVWQFVLAYHHNDPNLVALYEAKKGELARTSAYQETV